MAKQENSDLNKSLLKAQFDQDVNDHSKYTKAGSVQGSDKYNTAQLVSDSLYSDSDETTIKEMLLKVIEWGTYLFSKWVIILLFGLLGGGLGILYSLSKKPQYIAELTFVLEGGSKSGGLDSYAGLASQFGINMGSGGGEGVFEGESFLALMRSRLMIEKALLTPVIVRGNKISLAEFYIEIKNLREQWKNDPKKENIQFLPGANPLTFTKEENSLISDFHGALVTNNLTIDKLDKKSNIISLRVSSENELFSKYLAEVLVKEVSQFYVETKTKRSVDNVRILQNQTDSIRLVFNSSMIGAAASIDANPNPNLARQVLKVPAQRRQGDAQVNQAILSQLVQNLEIAKMTLRKETPLVQVIDRPVLPLVKKEFGKAKGLVYGGLIGGLAIVIFLITRRLFIQIIA